MKKLRKSNDDKVVAGILGGLGEYLDIDSVVLRLLWILIVLATGVIPGVLAYGIAIFIVPSSPANTPNTK